MVENDANITEDTFHFYCEVVFSFVVKVPSVAVAEAPPTLGRNILKPDEYFNKELVKALTPRGNKSSVWWYANIGELTEGERETERERDAKSGDRSSD